MKKRIDIDQELYNKLVGFGKGDSKKERATDGIKYILDEFEKMENQIFTEKLILLSEEELNLLNRLKAFDVISSIKEGINATILDFYEKNKADIINQLENDS
jgi:hypothetical protein